MSKKNDTFRPVYEVDASAYVKVPTYIIGQLIVEYKYSMQKIQFILWGQSKPIEEVALLLEPYRIQRGIKLSKDAMKKCTAIVNKSKLTKNARKKSQQVEE